MWTYSTNYMGPMPHWYEINEIPYREMTWYSELFEKEITTKQYTPEYAGGRVDAYGDYDDEDYEPYGVNLYVPIMTVESWNRYSDWLETVQTDKLFSGEELVERYQREIGTLDIWKDKDVVKSE